MELESIIKLINTVSESSLSGFTLEDGEVKLSLEKTPAGQITAASSEQVSLQTIQTTAIQQQSLSQKEAVQEGAAVKSPLVGTFYNAPTPESEAFVKLGDHVQKGQVLGIIEAMKLMNEIECEFNGIVKEILVSNEEMVEYGQVLFVIEEK